MLLLGYEQPQDMDSQALVIRIRIPDGGAVDWTVQPATQLLFRDILDVIGQVLPDATTTAFEYEDEDGDRITVRSDEEMKAMLSYYCNMVLEQQGSSPLIEPLQIYPRACKPPGKRNIHGLKVNTRAGSSSNCSPSVSDSLPSNSLKTSSAELKKILANGQINELDIQNRDILGHGNGGTVYNCSPPELGPLLPFRSAHCRTRTRLLHLSRETTLHLHPSSSIIGQTLICASLRIACQRPPPDVDPGFTAYTGYQLPVRSQRWEIPDCSTRPAAALCQPGKEIHGHIGAHSEEG